MTRQTRVRYSLAQESRVRLTVCDVQGREVAVLADGMLPAGEHAADWERTAGHATSAGMYFICLDTVVGRLVRRVAVLR